MASPYGILSLLPIVLVLVIAIATKRVIEPLAVGAAVGFVLLDGFGCIGGLVDGVYAVFQGDTLGMIVAVTLLFGVLIQLLEKSKSAAAFSVAIGEKVKSAKASLFAAWIVGIILFIDDFLNAIVVGATMRKTTDRYGVPREMLAYITDVTAGPMAVLLPFSAWAVFFMSMFQQLGLPEVTGLSTFEMYWRTIPFIFYALAAILMVPLVILGIIPPLGPMKKAYGKAALAGAVEGGPAEDTGRARPYHFMVPILVLVIATFVLNGDVVQGTILALLVTVLLYRFQGLLSNEELSECVRQGVINMIPVTGIIFFVLLLVEANVRLGTTEYILGLVMPHVSAHLLPVICFFVVCVLAFTTGSFFGTAAVVMPIVVPMALASGCNLYLVLGATISGAVFGSHCCFFGDATVLASTSCEIEPLQHAVTQLPYGLLASAAAAALYTVFGFVL